MVSGRSVRAGPVGPSCRPRAARGRRALAEAASSAPTRRPCWTALLTAALGACLLPFGPAPVSAQEQGTVRVLEQGTDAVLSRATVEVLAADGRRIAAGFTDEEGVFRWRLTGAAELRVHAERLGYGPAQLAEASPEEALRGLTLRLPVRPLGLPGIEVTTEQRCESEEESAERVWALWTDARTALRAALLTEEEGLVAFRVASWLRDVDLLGNVHNVLHEREWLASGQPFHTLPPAVLAEEGYVQADGDSIAYFGPDARALLSDDFLDTHCFGLDAQGEEGLVGLTFEPLPDRSIPDIRGTLWMDASSRELRRVDYEFVVPGAGRGDVGRGWTEFRALPEGPWIVSRWSILMPLPRQMLMPFRESGGEVRRIISTHHRDPGEGADVALDRMHSLECRQGLESTFLSSRATSDPPNRVNVRRVDHGGNAPSGTDVRLAISFAFAVEIAVVKQVFRGLAGRHRPSPYIGRFRSTMRA